MWLTYPNALGAWTTIFVVCLAGHSLSHADGAYVGEHGRHPLSSVSAAKSRANFAFLSPWSSDVAVLTSKSGQNQSHTEELEEAKGGNPTVCVVLAAVLLFMCMCSQLLAKALDGICPGRGEQAASAISSISTTAIMVYLLVSGTYSAWWTGKAVGSYCRFLCLWAFFVFVFTSVLLCCMCSGMLGALVIKNHIVKQIRDKFKEMEPGLPGPRREYYKSEAFRTKCDAAFDKADDDKNGVLDMSELKDVVLSLAHNDQAALDQMMFYALCFDQNGNSKVEKDEFPEMMKFFSVSMLRADGRSQTIPQSPNPAEQYFEILQLPETCTSAQASKSFRKLSVMWHPDKQWGVSKDVASADFAELTGAHDEVVAHLKKLDR